MKREYTFKDISMMSTNSAIQSFTDSEIIFTMTMDAPDNTKFFMADTQYKYKLLVLNFASKCEIEQSPDGTGMQWKPIVADSSMTMFIDHCDAPPEEHESGDYNIPNSRECANGEVPSCGDDRCQKELIASTGPQSNPANPRSLKRDQATGGMLNISWVAPKDSGGVSLLSYDVQFGLIPQNGNDQRWSNLCRVPAITHLVKTGVEGQYRSMNSDNTLGRWMLKKKTTIAPYLFTLFQAVGSNNVPDKELFWKDDENRPVWDNWNQTWWQQPTQSDTPSCFDDIVYEAAADPTTISATRLKITEYKDVDPADPGEWIVAAIIDGSKSTWNYDSSLWTDTSTFDIGGEKKTEAFNSVPSKKIRVRFERNGGGGTCVKELEHEHNLDMPLRELFMNQERLNANQENIGTTAVPLGSKLFWREMGCGNFAEQQWCNRHGFNVEANKNKVRYGIAFNNQNNCNNANWRDAAIGLGIKSIQNKRTTHNIAAGSYCKSCHNMKFGKKQDYTVKATICE